MDNIQIFNNEELGTIRIMGTPDAPLFCLGDVCKMLGLRQGHVRERLDDGVVSTEPILDSLGREQVANFVTEDGLYDVILDSRKPEAKRFRKWVTSEVLPTIRKHGAYMTKDTLERAIAEPDFLIQLATTLKEEKAKRLEAEQQCEAQKQIYYRRNWLDKWESLGSYAKIYPQAYGIRIVQNREGKYLVRTELYKPMEKPEQTYEFAELLDNALLHFTEQGKEYWVYLENMTCLTRKPEFVTIGFLDFLKIGGVYMRRGRNNGETYRRAEIRMYDAICFLGSREVFVKTAYRKYHYYIQQRSLDGKHFVLSDSMKPKESSTWFDMYYDGKNPPIVERRKKDYEIYGVKK